MAMKIKYKPVSDNLREMVNPMRSNHSRASIGMENVVAEYFFMSVNDLIPYKNQARKIFDEGEIHSLAESIKQHGIRQPLTIIPSETHANKYEVISGERRLRAAQIVELKKVPCIILNNTKEADAIALIENIHRSDLHPLEIGVAYKNAIDSGVFATQAELSEKIAVPKSSVTENIQLAELPEHVKEYIIKNNITGRDKLRDFVKAHSKGEDIVIGLSSGTRIDKKLKNSSVLRVLYTKEGLTFQDKGVAKLDEQAKQTLKLYLEKLLSRM